MKLILGILLGIASAPIIIFVTVCVVRYLKGKT